MNKNGCHRLVGSGIIGRVACVSQESGFEVSVAQARPDDSLSSGSLPIRMWMWAAQMPLQRHVCLYAMPLAMWTKPQMYPPAPRKCSPVELMCSWCLFPAAETLTRHYMWQSQIQKGQRPTGEQEADVDQGEQPGAHRTGSRGEQGPREASRTFYPYGGCG